jgi:hypothetical protein
MSVPATQQFLLWLFFQTQLSRCLEFQQITEESRNRMKDLQQACLEQADNFQLELAKKHQEEVWLQYVYSMVTVSM